MAVARRDDVWACDLTMRKGGEWRVDRRKGWTKIVDTREQRRGLDCIRDISWDAGCRVPVN